MTRPANQLSKVVLFKSDTIPSEETVEDNKALEAQEADVKEEVAVEEQQDDVSKAGYGKMKKKGKKMMPKMEVEDDEEEMEEDEMEKGKKSKMKKDESDEIEIPAEIYDYIETLEAANAELVDTLSKLAEEAEEQEEEILKSADPKLVAIVKGLEERATAAEAIAKAERDHRLEQEFISKAASLKNLPISAAEFGVVLKGVADSLTDEQFNAIWQVLSAANANLSNSAMFSEVGKSVSVDSDGPMSVIEKAAAALRQVDPSLTREQSIAKAVSADANLYKQYVNERK
ncbi:MAG: hypothetical protein EBU84_05480 [Actinobacteria bacterium]|nr:hypothetical protein [Actinomycetota bacterium]